MGVCLHFPPLRQAWAAPNGARIRLAPQKDWEVNDPAQLARVLEKLEAIQKAYNDTHGGEKKVSLADLIVAGGFCRGREGRTGCRRRNQRALHAGPRMDASQEQTDVDSFRPLEPRTDAFRNYLSGKQFMQPEEAMVDRAQLLTLTGPEMTVLLGGMRVLGTNAGGTDHGVLTKNVGQLTNDFFLNLLTMETEWKAAADGSYEGRRPQRPTS